MSASVASSGDIRRLGKLVVCCLSPGACDCPFSSHMQPQKTWMPGVCLWKWASPSLSHHPSVSGALQDFHAAEVWSCRDSVAPVLRAPAGFSLSLSPMLLEPSHSSQCPLQNLCLSHHHAHLKPGVCSYCLCSYMGFASPAGREIPSGGSTTPSHQGIPIAQPIEITILKYSLVDFSMFAVVQFITDL